MRALGVLVPPYDADPGDPADRPIGRAALRLEAEGVAVVFGHRAASGVLRGVRATPDGWFPTAAAVAAAYDRFPSRSRPEAYAALRAGLPDTPIANPPSLVDLCSDKLACQGVLTHLPVPELEADPARFAATLRSWGTAFLKPRYGAFGRGVRRVTPGDPLPGRGEGALPGVTEPLFLHRAVPPPAGWAGIACRILVQRTPDGWHVCPAVARRHRTDPVVNAARGAEVVPLQHAAPAAVEPVAALARQAAVALGALPDGDLLVELGVDLVLDAQHQPWLIEVNSRPRGRLEALARLDPARWQEAHVQACARPLRTLAARAAGNG